MMQFLNGIGIRNGIRLDISDVFSDYGDIFRKNFVHTYMNIFDGYMIINAEPDFTDSSGFFPFVDKMID